MGFVNMRNKDTGVVESLPEHYLTHPVFGSRFELTDEDHFCTSCVLPEPEPVEVEEPRITPLSVYQNQETEED